MTQRTAPQSFQVLPILVWKVYADGRPDELVRGVDIVGTPLAAMNRILVTGQKTEVFNGICGAESGNVPVSAASPAILFAELEVQKRPHTLNRPPILPPPGLQAAPPAGVGEGRPAMTHSLALPRRFARCCWSRLSSACLRLWRRRTTRPDDPLAARPATGDATLQGTTQAGTGGSSVLH